MYIVGFIILEIATLHLCVKYGNKPTDEEMMVKYGDNGYKLNRETLGGKPDGVIIETDIKSLPMPLALLAIFIPGINFIYARIKKRMTIKAILNEALKQNLLIPMTDIEKEVYNMIVTNESKLGYINKISILDKKEEVVGIQDGIVLIKSPDSIATKEQKLFPISYTLEDIKKLSIFAGGTYILGYTKDQNIAFIGLPSGFSKKVNKIFIEENEITSEYSYTVMTDEEAKDKKFVVYPVEPVNDIEDCVNEIRENRHKNTSSNSTNTSIYNYLPNEEATHHLVKTIYNKRTH